MEEKWQAYLDAKAETRFAEAEFNLADANHVEQAIFRLCACEAAEKNAYAEYQAARIMGGTL